MTPLETQLNSFNKQKWFLIVVGTLWNPNLNIIRHTDKTELSSNSKQTLVPQPEHISTET